MVKVVTKALFRRRWHVVGISAGGVSHWLATFKNPEDAANWAYDLDGTWALKASDFQS